MKLIGGLKNKKLLKAQINFPGCSYNVKRWSFSFFYWFLVFYPYSILICSISQTTIEEIPLLVVVPTHILYFFCDDSHFLCILLWENLKYLCVCVCVCIEV